MIECRIGRCEPRWIVHVHIISLMGPIEQPMRVPDRQIYTSMGLWIAKARPPVGAMHGACLVEIHRPGHIIPIIIIGGIIITHGLGFLLLVDLEQAWSSPEWLQTGRNDGGE